MSLLSCIRLGFEIHRHSYVETWLAGTGGEEVCHLVGKGLVILQTVGFITDEQITDTVPSEALLMQPEGLVREDEDLHMQVMP